MEGDSLRAAAVIVTAEVEQAHDAAHVTGRVAEEMRRLRAMTEAERVDLMVYRCREFARIHRDTAIFFAKVLAWFKANPNAGPYRTRGNTTYTATFARAEFDFARYRHGKDCAQLGHWLAEQARHRAGPLVLPPAANCDAPNSSTASTAA